MQNLQSPTTPGNPKGVRTLEQCDDLLEKRIVEGILEKGWFVAHLPKLELPDSPEATSAAYTIGLWHSCAHPEIVVLGLTPEKSQALLDYVATQVKGQKRFDSDGSFEGILYDYRCRLEFIGTGQHRDFLPYCRWFYRGDHFRAQQLCWPDAFGVYPGQTGFEERLRCQQPFLGTLL
jgi:hypothetical protein